MRTMIRGGGIFTKIERPPGEAGEHYEAVVRQQDRRTVGKRQSAKDAALVAIGREWDSWTNGARITNATWIEAFRFYGYLTIERPHMLDFPTTENKWQTVRGYLLRTKRMTD
jgi:hypothetical protein